MQDLDLTILGGVKHATVGCLKNSLLEWYGEPYHKWRRIFED